MNQRIFGTPVLTILLTYYVWSKRRLYYLSWKLNGPIGFPLIGSIYVFKILYDFTNVLPLGKILLERYWPHKVIRIWAGETMYITVTDADVAHQINATNLLKADVYKYIGNMKITRGLFVDNDLSHWKSSRKIISQFFHLNMLKSFVPTFHDEALILNEQLKKYSDTKASLYLPDLMELTTFNSIMRNGLGFNPRAHIDSSQPFIRDLHSIFMHFQRKMFIPVLRNSLVYSLLGWGQDEIKSTKSLFSYTQHILDRISKSELCDDVNIQKNSLVEILRQFPDITTEEIQSQMITIIGAALDTSMTQNSMLLLMLAIHTEIQNKVYQEMVEVLGPDPNECPTYEKLMKLEYMDTVIKETLRMYPAAPLTARQISEDLQVTIDGKEYTFPAGVNVGILIYSIQNSSDYYENPNIFDPDRWLPENIAKRHPKCYFPFGSGPRNCIGGKYALLLMKTLAVTILRKYQIMGSETFKTMDDVQIRMNMTLEIAPKCQIQLQERV